METNVDSLPLARETPNKRKYDGAPEDDCKGQQPALRAPEHSLTSTPPRVGPPPATGCDITAAPIVDALPISNFEKQEDSPSGPDKDSFDVAKVDAASAVTWESKQQQGQPGVSKTSGGRKGKGKQRGNHSRTTQARGIVENGAGSSTEVPGTREANKSGKTGSTEYVKIAQYSTEREVVADVKDCQPVTVLNTTYYELLKS